jgi:hypothetical protein
MTVGPVNAATVRINERERHIVVQLTMLPSPWMDARTPKSMLSAARSPE